MTEHQKLLILNKFAKELLKYYNTKLLVESGLVPQELPIKPYDLYTTLSELGAKIEMLLMETDIALGLLAEGDLTV